MKFEYIIQPLSANFNPNTPFPDRVLTDLRPKHKYFTLTETDPPRFTVTTRNSQAMRFPLFKFRIKQNKELAQGVLFAVAGMEQMARFILAAPLYGEEVTRVIIFVADNCFQEGDDLDLIFFAGISIEVKHER